ncbi:MAG: hypothetical protein HOG49_25165 [Candidatus Scalindua sp.]|jgi:hypothetical protein|nr:hypothetical protein [Candidatus Scalindua sp.]
MKQRNGFVSNSSSSSFVVVFPSTPKNEEDIQSILSSEDFTLNNSHAVSIMQSIKEQKDSTLPQRLSIFNDNWWDVEENISSYPNALNFIDKDGVLNQKEYKAQIVIDFLDELGDENFTAKVLEMADKEIPFDIYCFNFADESGAYWGEMEHGNLFRNVTHITRSNH